MARSRRAPSARSAFTVSAGHTYEQGGTYTATVTCNDAGGASVSTNVNISVAGMSTNVNDLSLYADKQNLVMELATGHDTNTQASVSGTINWGDGTTSSASVMNTNGQVQIYSSGTKTYTQEGYYQITINLSDSAGAKAVAETNVNVTDGTLTATNQLPSSAQNTTSWTGQIASLSDSDSSQGGSSIYSAVTNWGDGTAPSSDTVTGLYVSGFHQFAANAVYTVKTTITDVDGSVATVSGTLDISAPTPFSVTPAGNLGAVAGTAFSNMTLLTFTDNDHNTQSSAYNNSSIQWGDGTTSQTTVTGSGTFTFAGSHTYSSVGSYTILAKIADMDSSQETVSLPITVSAAALSVTSKSLTAAAGYPMSPTTVATFTDANPSEPVGNLTALVNWGDNTPPTAGYISGSNGNFTVTAAHLYASTGSPTAVVTVYNTGGASASANDSVTVSAPAATLTVNAVTATEGTSYSNSDIATFTPASGTGGDTFVATLGWGNGAVTYGTLTANGGSYDISGSNTYAEQSNVDNPETVTVTVLDSTTGLIAALGTASVTVNDASLTAAANAITAWPNQTTGNIAVATFTDANSGAPASDFSASINWGDGSGTTAGTVLPTQGAGAGHFTVWGQHTYTSANGYTVQTTIDDVGSSTQSASGTATVSTATANLSATENSQFSGVIATVSGNSSYVTGVSINWGDGSTSTGTYGSGQSSFTVSGVHTYAEDGVYNLSVTVYMSQGGNLSAAGPAVVADATLSGTARNLTGSVGLPLGFVAGTSDNPVTVATFSDGNTAAPAADFTATINWGDGTTSAGAVSGSAGSYSVSGNHSYVQPGAYTITTNVLDAGGMDTNVQGTATIGIIEGQEYKAVLNLSLPDPVTTSPPSSYNASITWGDGSSSTATATPVYNYANGALTGSLLVTATHVYAASGNVTVSATATDPNTSNSSNGTLALTVADALLNAIPQSISAVAGDSTGTVTVAQFEDDNASATTTEFNNVSINWGDGSGTTTGTVVATSTPGLFSVQGSHTYSSATNRTISASLSDSGGQSVTITSSATVSNAWTLLSAGSQTADPTRANFVTLQPGLPLSNTAGAACLFERQDDGSASVIDVSQGAIRVIQPLDFDQSPGNAVGGYPALVYNSATVSPRPVIQFELQSDPNTSDPAATQYQVAWSFNNVNQTTQTFTVSSYQAGAIYLFAVQVGTAVTSTGVYPWSATITITRSDHSTVQLTPSGYVPVVVRDASPYGAGWGVDGLHQLYPISANGVVPAGVLLITGAGYSRFYVSNGQGGFTNSEDPGTLVQSGSNYVYTATNQVTEDFNSSGLETSYNAPPGLDTEYSYTNGSLTGVSAYDGGSTTLNYDSHGILQSIDEPGSRTVTISQTDTQVGGIWEGVLNQITNVDGTTRSFGYSGHDMTSDSWAPMYTSFTFSSTTGLLTGVTLGENSTTIPYTIVSAASDGLSSTSGTVTTLPGLPIPVPLAASIKDGNGHTSTYYLDQRGRLLEFVDGAGNTTVNQLNSAGDVTLSVDGLGRVTANTWDSYRDITKTVNADGSFTINRYDPTFHELTESTNSLGETATNTYDSSTGLITSSTDALGNTTYYVWSGGVLQSETDALGRTTLFRDDGDDREIAEIDSAGNWTLTGYNSYGFVDSTTNALGWVSLTTTNARGLITSTEDPNGNVRSMTYYADGSQYTVTDAQGFTSTTTIDVRGLTTSQTDDLGNTWICQFDAAGNMTGSTDPDGNETTYGFSANNLQISMTDPLRNETQYQRDADADIIKTTDPAGNVTLSYFNLVNLPVLTVDPMGYSQFTVLGPTGETLATINQIGALSRTLYNADDEPVMTIDPLGNTGETQYDADGQTVLTTDGRGYSTQYLYTPTGAYAAVIDPNLNVTRYVTNAVGETVQAIDGNAHSSYAGFDFDRRQNSTTNGDGDTSQTVFSVTGATVESIDANGNGTFYTLDGDDRTIKTEDPDGNVTQQSFNAAGLVMSKTDAEGNTTNLGYNKDRQQTSSTNANGAVATTDYNQLGQQVASYDQSGNGTYSGFNANGQHTGSGLQTGSSTVESFYATGQMSQLTDPDGNRTIFLINQDGNSVGQISPLGNMSFVSYNQDNQPTVTVDADGRAIDYSYDPGGREASEIWLAADGTQQNSVSWGYDQANNVVSASNDYGSYGFTLDDANHMTAETTPFNISIGFGYDNNANNTSMTFAGATETSVYNGDNLLTSRSLSGGPDDAQMRFDITYTPDNQMATLKRYADTAGVTFLGETQKTYNSVGDVTEIKDTNASGTTLEDFQYTWTVSHLLSSETDTISGTPTTTDYGYDSSDQLISAGSTSYSYDPNGNRTMSGYQVGPDNQIVTDGTWNYKYDPAGNLTEKDGVSNGLTWKYTYDNKNELIVAAEYSGGTLQYQISYFYDPFGNVVEQDETQNGTTTVTKFVYDQYGNAILDLNSSNQVEFTRVFLNMSDSEVMRIYSDGTEYWYLANRLGSVTGLMDNSGRLADAITYDAFGDPSQTAPQLGDLYQFAGGKYDSVTGLSHFGARDYAPAIGRWSSQDPLGFASGDTNLYRYVLNMPVVLTDQTGLAPTKGSCGGIMVDLVRAQILGQIWSAESQIASWESEIGRLVVDRNGCQNALDNLLMQIRVFGPGPFDDRAIAQYERQIASDEAGIAMCESSITQLRMLIMRLNCQLNAVGH